MNDVVNYPRLPRMRTVSDAQKAQGGASKRDTQARRCVQK